MLIFLPHRFEILTLPYQSAVHSNRVRNLEISSYFFTFCCLIPIPGQEPAPSVIAALKLYPRFHIDSFLFYYPFCKRDRAAHPITLY